MWRCVSRTAEKIAKATEKFEQTVNGSCSDADLAPLAACADAAGGLADCVLPAYSGAAIAVTELVYGPGGPIADANARSCQSAVGKASVNYVAAATKAMQTCLDKVNKGTLSGNGSTLCMGSLTPGGVVAPSDPATASKLAKAEDKLRAKIADKCGGTELMQLGTCGSDANSAGDCLTCTHWRQAVEVVRSTYGP